MAAGMAGAASLRRLFVGLDRLCGDGKANRVAVVPVAMGWSDLGSWDALDAITDSDVGGNAHAGEVIAVDTANCFVRADSIRVALVGVEDLIVVASGTDVLILPKGRSQEVKKIIEAIKAQG